MPSPITVSSDNDGWDDAVEKTMLTNPTASDADGLIDSLESTVCAFFTCRDLTRKDARINFTIYGLNQRLLNVQVATSCGSFDNLDSTYAIIWGGSQNGNATQPAVTDTCGTFTLEPIYNNGLLDITKFIKTANQNLPLNFDYIVDTVAGKGFNLSFRIFNKFNSGFFTMEDFVSTIPLDSTPL